MPLKQKRRALTGDGGLIHLSITVVATSLLHTTDLPFFQRVNARGPGTWLWKESQGQISCMISLIFPLIMSIVVEETEGYPGQAYSHAEEK